MPEHIELKLLRYVLAVADHGSLAAAAAAVHVGQPALSRQVAQVERYLGFTLFERHARGMSLNPAGRTYVEQARALIHQAENLDAVARTIESGNPPALRIAAPYVTITEILAPFIAHEPRVDTAEFTLVPAPGDTAYRMLGADADVAIASAPVPGNLECAIVGRVPLYAQMTARHPWSAKTSISIAELSNSKLLLREPGHQIRLITDQAFASAGQSYGDHVDCPVPRSAQALAARDVGVAVLTDDPAFGLAVVPIWTNSGPIEVAIHAAWHRDHYARGRIARTIESIAEYYQRRLEARTNSTPSRDNPADPPAA